MAPDIKIAQQAMVFDSKRFHLGLKEMALWRQLKPLSAANPTSAPIPITETTNVT